MNKLILFDFDGTITHKDSLWEFLVFYRGWPKTIINLIFLSPVLTLYAIGIVSNNTAKEILLKRFFKNESLDLFNQKCKVFATSQLNRIVRDTAKKQIELHRSQGATIVVVSASAENWVKPWCEQLNMDCIATRLEVKEGRLTGHYLGKNCYGPEKVLRIKSKYDLNSFDEIIAYGDSRGDKEMLALAHTSHYRSFPCLLKQQQFNYPSS
ncbi:MAG: HAD-IB family hydrolase [Cyclobacteriaceae bacterium]|nr:HAD-IB family hydrolase [Cyclobacteriaceae bacterium]